MRIRLAAALVLLLSVGGSLAAAENPFAGTWKLNPAKSKLTGGTTKFEKTASGAIRWSNSGLSYTFNVDGKEYPGPYGGVIVWKQIDDRTWELAYEIGNRKDTRTVNLSPDGQTMTTVIKGNRSNGEAFQNTVIRKRISGDKGLLGAWRDIQIKSSNPVTLEVKPFEQDGLVLTYVGQSTCEAQFDGKDYPEKGPTGITVALKHIGPRSFERLRKQNGKPLSRDTFTVSQDGHTLTIAGSPVAVNEPYTEVFERQ